MDILEKAQRILQQPVCDHCLGRQFARLLHGYSNKERGTFLRAAAAMSIDKTEEELRETGSTTADVTGKFDMSNFSFQFHNLDFHKKEKKKCSVCNGFFDDMGRWIKKIEKLKKTEFKTFLVGTKLSFEMVSAEEGLWEKVGIDYCEPIKAEINREIGKLVEKHTGKKYSSTPDVNFIINVAKNRVDIEINPLFIYGEYQKLRRGIPQTRWPSGKYKTSVEEIIAKPFMKKIQAKGHKFHGLGREDIDARCLAWRPFVLEFLRPMKRDINISAKIGSGVKVRKLRLSNIAEVRKIKESRAEKTYRMDVICEKPVAKSDFSKLSEIKEIRQRTPMRVIHRRGDRMRRRIVKSLSVKAAGKNVKKFTLTVRCDAGLYVKELVNGDGGRTIPSVSELLGTPCMAKDLDVVKIHV